MFNNGACTNLPPSIKFILDNLQSAYTLKHHGLFQRTLKALEIHLVNLEARHEAISSKLSGKEDIHSMDKMTIMGTDYARFSLKTQATLRSTMANGYIHQWPWYEGDSHLSYRDPYALADCWRNYFNNEILEVTRDLW